MKNEHKVVNSDGKTLSANLSYERAVSAMKILKAKSPKFPEIEITWADYTFQHNPVGGGSRWLPEREHFVRGRRKRRAKFNTALHAAIAAGETEVWR